MQRYNEQKSNKELKMSENLTYILGLGNLGTPELILILIVALLLFGRRLPEVARNLGRSLNEFKKGLNEAKDEKDKVEKDIKSIDDDASGDVHKTSGDHNHLN